MPQATDPVIIDIGVHKGDDSAFYLAKGFKVVGVEANPSLCRHVRQRFAKEIAAGTYELIEAAIADRAGQIEFYVNLDKDDWSSTDAHYGTRDNTRFEKISVSAMVFEALLDRFPNAYFVKCDIEGGDLHVLQGLLRSRVRPRYFSVEAQKAIYLAYLGVAGYSQFKLVNQNLNWLQRMPNPPREGVHVEHTFQGDSSGPFGEESPGTWMNFDETADMYLSIDRCQLRQPTISNAWYDFHAKMP